MSSHFQKSDSEKEKNMTSPSSAYKFTHLDSDSDSEDEKWTHLDSDSDSTDEKWIHLGSDSDSADENNLPEPVEELVCDSDDRLDIPSPIKKLSSVQRKSLAHLDSDTESESSIGILEKDTEVFPVDKKKRKRSLSLSDEQNVKNVKYHLDSESDTDKSEEDCQVYTFRDHQDEEVVKYQSCRSTPFQPIPIDPISSLFDSKPSECNRNCFRNCKNTINLNQGLELIKNTFKDLNGKSLKKKLLDSLGSQEYFSLSTTCFCVGKDEVCNKSFSRLIGVPERTIAIVLRDYKSGVTNYIHGNLGIKSHHRKSIEFMAWFYNFANKFGEQIPTSDAIHLPTYLTKADIFYYYVEENGRDQTINISTFYKILKFEFGQHRQDKTKPMVTIRKHSAHSKCTQCEAVKQFRRTAQTEVDVQLATSLLDQHHDLHQTERQLMVEALQSCIDNPSENLGISLDGMDNSKTTLPHSRVTVKSIANIIKLKTHVHGCIVSSGWYQGNRDVSFYINMDQFENGSNLTCTLIYKEILKFVNTFGRLPPKLHIVLDNCFRENKNQYVFAFAASLVELGIVQEVNFYFLQVGHTHDHVDQLFSTLTKKIRKHELRCLEDLVRTISTSNIRPKPKVEVLYHINDFKSFIIPKMDPNELANHSHYHCFKVTKENNITRLRAKPLISDKTFLPPTGIQLLKSGIELKEDIGVADFRVESLRLKHVLAAIENKYLPTIIDRQSRDWTLAQWKAMIATLTEVPLNKDALSKMNLHFIPRYKSPIESDVSHLKEIVRVKDPPILCGNVIPEICEAGRIREIQVGCDVVVYTQSVTDRPWVGRCVEVDQNSDTVTVNWYSKKQGRSKKFVSMKDRNGKLFQDVVSTQSVMLWGFTECRTGDSFEISSHWQNVINYEYEKHDNVFMSSE